MTEKRFTLKGLVEGVPNVCDDGVIIEQEDVVELLNAQHEENEQLKQRIKELEIENTAQSDAIDGLQEILTHIDLDEVIR